MPHPSDRDTASPAMAGFAVYMAAVLTVAMALFPPFTSVNGTEYAFVATGPEWARHLGAVGEGLGVTARIHWTALGVQVGTLWAIALGARWYLTPGARARPGASRYR
jgi:hypothetical protein